MAVIGSALAVFRNFWSMFGTFVDAIYYFCDSLINPSQGIYVSGRVVDRGPRSNGPRIATIRRPGNAPVTFTGCRSCQM